MQARSILRIAIPVIAIGLIGAIQVRYFDRGFIPGDAFTYLAAGERLNAGHALYVLSPGDRPVDIKPPYWTVPLLSPPPIAVLFRLFAVFGDAGAYIWWAICIAVVVATCVALLRRQPTLIGLAMLVLAIPLVYEIGVGNLNALVLGALTLAWYLMAHRRDHASGAAIALATALKVTPGILAWWLITQRRWGALRGFIVAGIACLAVSVAGAGLGAHFEYLSIVGRTSANGTSELSLAGLGRAVGLSASVASVLPTIALLSGIALVALLRQRPSAAWAVAVTTMVLGSPVVNVNWFTLLLAALAPLAWPLPRPERSGPIPLATGSARWP